MPCIPASIQPWGSSDADLIACPRPCLFGLPSPILFTLCFDLEQEAEPFRWQHVEQEWWDQESMSTCGSGWLAHRGLHEQMYLKVKYMQFALYDLFLCTHFSSRSLCLFLSDLLQAFINEHLLRLTQKCSGCAVG